jgi:hypothetical protein
LEHLDILHSEMPELFQPRDLSPNWDDGLIMVPIDNPEARIDDSLSPSGWDPEFLNYRDLENLLADPATDVSAAPPLVSPQILDAVGGTHPGAPTPAIDPNKMPPPDCFAFYLPFHYYHPTWWGGLFAA